MADEKKQGGLFSLFRKNKPVETPSADTGSKQQTVAASKQEPEKAPPASVPATPEKSGTKPAPAVNPASVPKQASLEKNIPGQEKNEKMEPVDTVAAIRTYIESVSNLGVNHLNMTSTILNNFTEYLAKQSGNQKQSQ